MRHESWRKVIWMNRFATSHMIWKKFHESCESFLLWFTLFLLILKFKPDFEFSNFSDTALGAQDDKVHFTGYEH